MNLLKKNNVKKKPFLIEYEKNKRNTNLETITEETENEESTKHSNVNNELSEKEMIQINKAAELLSSNHICPIFKVSNVTSQGINHLTKFIYNLKSRTKEIKSFNSESEFVEFDIHDHFSVTGSGIVVSGVLKSGTLREN